MAGRIQRYTRIKNEVLELLARGVLTFRQTRIALVIIRESWGWNAGRSNWTHKPLSITEIAKKAGFDKAHVCRELQTMTERKILQTETREMGIHYSFNEHENTWQKAYKRSKKATTHDPKEQHAIQKSNNELPKEQQRVAERATTTPVKLKRGAGSGDRKERSKERSKERRSSSLPLIDPNQTPQEIEALRRLHEVDGYPYDEGTDLAFIRSLVARYPDVDVFAEIADWCVRKIDKPLKPKESPRGQINTFCRNRQRWNKEANKSGKSGRHSHAGATREDFDLESLVYR